MENTLKKPMTGIIPPLVTPLLDNDKLDLSLIHISEPTRH